MRAAIGKLVLCLWLWVAAVAGVVGAGEGPFQQARRLESEGKLEEAFTAYLAIPGAEHAAARLARPRAEKFRAKAEALLRGPKPGLRHPRTLLVLGDLLLATGDKAGALKRYRQVVGSIGKTPEQDWAHGFMPQDYYPVEPPGQHGRHRPAQPFTNGPGSHRDNWLIRRFIALEAWADATREFARIWGHHRRAAGQEQSDGQGLQFAIHYAYFLKRHGEAKPSLDVLLEPFLRVDMDKNPNALDGKHRRLVLFGHSSGISRKEFVRVAYGAFKTAGKEETLVAALTKQIEAGQNRARRVLARVRLHQGKVGEALALELAYIQAGKFNALTAAYRRGLAYEDCQKHVEAVAEFEKALALPPAPVALPDPDEEKVQRAMMSQMPTQLVLGRLDPNSPQRRAHFKAELLKRLSRLYAALGRADKVLESTLRQLDATPALLEDFRSLERTARRFGAAGKDARFQQWARKRLAATKSPMARANLHWLLGDHAAAAKALAERSRENTRGYWTFREWKERFRRAGKDKLALLLRALIAANPKDARSRLELLDLEHRFRGDEVVEALELLLETGAVPAFARGKGDYNRTRFRNYFDLAYRLMRLYERRGELAKLRALGLRIASGHKPFSNVRQADLRRHQPWDGNNLPEDMNACLSLAIQHADKASLAALEKALSPMPRPAAKGQLARRKARGWTPTSRKPVGWANLPRGVAALACHGNVLSLACDARHIYAGMPWGVAIYSLRGEPVTRVALATAALDLLVHRKQLWAGTPFGLYRIGLGSWEVAHLALDGDLSGRRREPKRRSSNNCVRGLAADGDAIWIGTWRNIQRLHTRTNTLRIYSRGELGAGRAGDWTRFVIEPDYVWASSRDHAARYDRKTDTWAPVTYGEKPVGLIAFADAVLWGHVQLNNELRDRPCRIDRKTLAVTPILIEGNLSQSDRCFNGPFAYLGTWKGRPVLAPGWVRFFYDPEIGKLRRMPGWRDGKWPEFDSDLLPGLRTGRPWRKPNGTVVYDDNVTHRHEALPGFRFHASRAALARLPDGTTVLGGRRERSPRYAYPREDHPDGYETWDIEGGLYLISPDRKSVRRISSPVAPDTLPGDMVYDVANGSARPDWACTNRGLAALSEQGAVLAHFTRADGLVANRVAAGAELGGRVYFACGWGDHGGGLAVYDPVTAVFTSLVQSDGLATDKLADVQVQNGTLRLTYDVEYLRGKGKRRLHPPGMFDPGKGTVAAGGGPRVGVRDHGTTLVRDRWRTRRPMPCLGGWLLAERVHDGKRYLCGTRGLVIVRRGGAPRELAVRAIRPRLILDPAIAALAEAKAMPIALAAPADLARYLKHDNPFVRAKALAGLLRGSRRRSRLAEEYVGLVASQLQHPNVRVRSTAVYLLTRAKDGEAVVTALRKCLSDRDHYIRYVAAVDLCRRRHVPELKHLAEILRKGDDHGNLPFGADSTIGVQASRMDLYQALAPLATAEHFGLFLEHPLRADNYEPRQKVFRQLGQSLIEHPDAADLLLKAYDHDPHSWGQVRFAQAVFKHAGKPMLPRLHKALASPDRVVRSNGAMACGAIGDPSSVPHLINALKPESGLSRASIVWALGELKATEALPLLVTLYVDARNDEKRRAGSGFRGAQSQAAITAHYDSLSRLEAVGADWDEMKAAAAPKPVDPRRNEVLLRPRHVLEAVRKIGPAAAQEFYRTLAGERDREGRQEAAERLAECTDADRKKNVVILKNLLADDEASVRIRAAVSLLILGEDAAKRSILDLLGSSREWEKQHTLKQLARVTDVAKLRFAQRHIEAIAADPNVNRYTREPAQALRQRLRKP